MPANVPPTWASVRIEPRAHEAPRTKKQTVVCRDCHDESDGKFAVLGEAACTKCHEPQLKLHARRQGGRRPHGVHDVPRVRREARADVHQLSRRAARQARGRRRARHEGCAVHVVPLPHRDPQVKQADCAKCHTKVSASHGKQHVASDVTQARGWLDAGVGLVASPGSPAADRRAGCTDCHAPHTKAVAAKTTCTGCHASAPKGPHPSNHAACTTCHAPHDFERAAVAPCAGCHANKQKRRGEPRARRLHDVPCRARRPREEGRLHDLSLHAAHARRDEGPEARRLHVLPLAARSEGITGGGVHDVSREHQPEARARQVGPMHRLSRAASEGATAGHPASTLGAPGNHGDRARLLDVPQAGEVRHGVPCQGRRVYELPRAAHVLDGEGRSGVLPEVSRRRATPGRDEQGTHRLPAVPCRPSLTDAAEGHVRDVPQGRGDHRTRRPSGLQHVPRASRGEDRSRGRRVQVVSREGGRERARARQRREQRERQRLVQHVPSAARTERPRVASGVHDVSHAWQPSFAPPRRRRDQQAAPDMRAARRATRRTIPRRLRAPIARRARRATRTRRTTSPRPRSARRMSRLPEVTARRDRCGDRPQRAIASSLTVDVQIALGGGDGRVARGGHVDGAVTQVALRRWRCGAPTAGARGTSRTCSRLRSCRSTPASPPSCLRGSGRGSRRSCTCRSRTWPARCARPRGRRT